MRVPRYPVDRPADLRDRRRARPSSGGASRGAPTTRLGPSGRLTVISSVAEQGQGTDTILAQVAASTVGVPLADVGVVTGDTMVTPYGGGTWGGRGGGSR